MKAAATLTRAERRVLRDLVHASRKAREIANTHNLGTTQTLLRRLWNRGLVRLFARPGDRSGCLIRGVKITAAGRRAAA